MSGLTPQTVSELTPQTVAGPLARRRRWADRGILVLHLMILPSLLATILFKYLPLYGIVIAFKDYDVFDGIWASAWADNGGFEHFIDFFRAPNFSQVLRNTLVISVLKLGLLSLPPVALALMLNETSHRGFKKTAQTVSYLPHFISWVVVGGMISNFLRPTPTSPLNALLLALGLVNEPVDLINDRSFFVPLLILSDFWKEVGFSSIIYLAVIAGIDQEMYEACEIDGGGRWTKAIHITWPHLLGTFMILLILRCSQIMEGTGDTFDQVYILGTPFIRSVSDIVDTLIVRVGLEHSRHAYATAAGLFKSVINLAVLITVNNVSWRLTGKGLFR